MANITRTKLNKLKPAKLFIYMDVGGWLGRDDGGSGMTFGIITGGVVALCCYNEQYDPFYRKFNKWKRDLNKRTGYRPAFTREEEFKKFPNFVALLKTLGRGYNHILDHITTWDSNEYLTDQNQIIIFLPDLHLHYFKETLVDNFVEVSGFLGKTVKKRVKGCSLESQFVEFLRKLLRFKKSNPHIKMEIVQLGDMYEMWETNFGLVLMKIMGVNKDYFNDPNIIKKIAKLDMYKESIIAAMSNPKPIRPPTELKRMIESVYPKIFGLLNKSHTKLRGEGAVIPFHILQGNHDNYLYWKPPNYTPIKNRGIWSRKTLSQKKIIHAEHGHFAEDDNYGNWKFGYAVTCANMLAEMVGKGAAAKTVPAWYHESKHRKDPIKYARTARKQYYNPYSSQTARWYFRNKHKHVAVFCMAHTHIPILYSWS